MAFNRITLTTIGAGVSATLDLQRWNGSAWVSHTTGIAKALFQGAGYVFEDNTGSTTFKVVDNGSCGTETIFNCELTTTIEPTTTELPTTEAPTTTELPTTTPLMTSINYSISGNTGNGRVEVIGVAPASNELLNIATNNSVQTGSINVDAADMPYTVTAYNTSVSDVAKLRVCGDGAEVFYDADITTIDASSDYLVNPTPDACVINATFNTADTPDECEPTTTLAE